MQVIASSLSRPPAGKTGAAAADPPCRKCRLRPSPKGLGRAKRRGCGDCVLPSSAPGSGRPRSPAEMSFFGVYLSNQHNVGVNQRRGEVPSFVVSRMGSRGREIEIPSPGVLSLFVHFLFARAKRKWTPTGANRCVLPPSFARAKKKRPRDSLVKGKRGGSSRRAARRLFGRLYLSSPERSNSSVSPHLGQSIEPSSSVSSSKVISSPQTGHLTS